ncbi:crossover junction endodeoxyribonuclease RuvC [bacterium]
MRILGIDPGTAATGWGIICNENRNAIIIDYGCVLTPANTHLALRLDTIHKEVSEIISKHKPDIIAVEQLFFASNVKTAISVGHARGVILLTAQQSALPIFEYTPLQIKQAITGYGRANKKQIQYMVQRLLKLKNIPKPDDAADALAVALCHNNMNKFVCKTS